jgi:hypothetical protein
MSSMMARARALSTAAVGSSASTRRGWWARARRMATRCRCPMDRAEGIRSRQPAPRGGRPELQPGGGDIATLDARGQADVLTHAQKRQQAAGLQHVTEEVAAQGGQGIFVVTGPQGRHVACGPRPQVISKAPDPGRSHDQGDHVQASVLLPQPLSPMTATICPGRTVKRGTCSSKTLSLWERVLTSPSRLTMGAVAAAMLLQSTAGSRVQGIDQILVRVRVVQTEPGIDLLVDGRYWSSLASTLHSSCERCSAVMLANMSSVRDRMSLL